MKLLRKLGAYAVLLGLFWLDPMSRALITMHTAIDRLEAVRKEMEKSL